MEKDLDGTLVSSQDFLCQPFFSIILCFSVNDKGRNCGYNKGHSVLILLPNLIIYFKSWSFQYNTLTLQEQANPFLRKNMRFSLDKLSIILFCLVVSAGIWGYGAISYRDELFPVPFMKKVFGEAGKAWRQLLIQTGFKNPKFFFKAQGIVNRTTVHSLEGMMPGLTLISRITRDNNSKVEVINEKGKIIHSWEVDWFELWPNADHLTSELVPKSRPGAIIHGMVLFSNGDIAFNFERLGLTRLKSCGGIVWRLPYRTHHSLHLDESGHLYAGGQKTHHEFSDKFPNHKPPFEEFTVLEISPEGKILEEISVFELLQQNGLEGLMYQSTLKTVANMVSGDTLHLNDVETFPSNLKDGLFTRGDVMISLRNIKAIAVFNQATKKIKFLSVGKFLRQHDPDFVGDSNMTIFDNNSLKPRGRDRFSRIVHLDAKKNRVEVLFSGSNERPFYSDIMGKHQNLPNGNILVTESMNGRVFEINKKSVLLWEYYNLLDKELLGMVGEAIRLPTKYDKAFFKNALQKCREK